MGRNVKVSSAKLKIISDQTLESDFFCFPKSPGRRKQLLLGIPRYGRKVGGEFDINNTLVFELHFNQSDINISIKKSKNYLKRSTVPTFHDMKKGLVQVKGNPQLSEKNWTYKKGPLLTDLSRL